MSFIQKRAVPHNPYVPVQLRFAATAPTFDAGFTIGTETTTSPGAPIWRNPYKPVARAWRSS